MDSLDTSLKASDFGKKNVKQRRATQAPEDTDEKKAARIALYASRANQKGPNGRPVNIFTGQEYGVDDLVEVDEDTEDEENFFVNGDTWDSITPYREE